MKTVSSMNTDLRIPTNWIHIQN